MEINTKSFLTAKLSGRTKKMVSRRRQGGEDNHEKNIFEYQVLYVSGTGRFQMLGYYRHQEQVLYR